MTPRSICLPPELKAQLRAEASVPGEITTILPGEPSRGFGKVAVAGLLAFALNAGQTVVVLWLARWAGFIVIVVAP